MASLENNTIADTYPLLLKVDANGVDGTLRAVEGGEGTDTALKVSTGAVQVDNIKIDGNTISSTDTNGNIVLSPNGSGTVTAGTIGSGVWNGTAIASAYLDADTAHLSGAQTISGAKTFSTYVKLHPSASTSSYVQFAYDASTTYGYIGSESSIVSGGTATNMTIGASADTSLTLTTNGVVRATLNSDGIYLGRLFTGEHNSDYGEIGEGYHIDGNTAKYRYSDTATRLYMGANAFNFYGAAAGTAGNNITWVHKMALDASGQLGVGLTSPETLVHISAGDPGVAPQSDVKLCVEDNTDVTISTLSPDGSWNGFQMGSASDNTGAILQWNYTNKQLYLGTTPYSDGGKITFHTGTGTERMRITSDGNVGIGTTSPVNSKLCVLDTFTGTQASSEGIRFISAGDPTRYNFIENNISSGASLMGFFIDAGSDNTSKRVMTVHRNGVGIGVETPTAPLEVYEASGACQVVIHSNGDDAILDLDATSNKDSQVRMYEAGTFRWRIRHKADNNDRLEIFDLSNVGVYLNTGDTSWSNTSDERLKENLIELTGATERLNKLRCVNFNWKFDNDKTKHLGLLAQDVEKVFPEVVSGDSSKDIEETINKDGEIERKNVMGVDYTSLVPALIKAVQELSAKVTALENA